MGTSNSYGGPGGNTPLIPSWLTSDDGAGSADPQQQDSGDDQQNSDGDDEPNDGTDNEDNKVVTPSVAGGRFQNARNNFTRFARSGGRDSKALGRAVSGYISRSLGGASNASKRMGSSRRVAGGLISFLSSASSTGLQNALNQVNLGHLVGQSAENIFLELADIICPKGGSVDEGIARNAYFETIVDLASQGITDLNSLTAEQVFAIIQTFAANSIEARLCNDIGTKICMAPQNAAAVENVERQLHDFIYRAVSDSLEKYGADIAALTSEQTSTIVDTIYTEAYTILESYADQQSE